MKTKTEICRKSLSIALIFLGCLCYAQQYDVIDRVKSDWRKMAAMEGIHRFDWTEGAADCGYGNLTVDGDRSVPEFSKAPKGYKPFYISHYGRHGSRYAWDYDQYVYLRDILTAARDSGALTPLGEDFCRKYLEFYRMPMINTGYLTELGFLQHRRLGQYMYDAFPEVFSSRGAGAHPRVEAISSVSQRCIVSMGAFCLGLQGREPQLDITLSSNSANMATVAPVSAQSEFKRKFKGPEAELGLEDYDNFRHSIVDYDSMVARVFSDPEFIKRYPGGRSKFLGQMFSFLGGYRNYCQEPVFDGIFTADQMASLWEATNYSSYCYDYKEQYSQIPLLEDIVDKAEQAVNCRRSSGAKGGSSSKVADLRFGHDYVLEAFMFLLGANGCNTVPSSASEVKYWYQSYNITMATTVLFVLYAKPGSDDILFKLIWNEEEATIPRLNPVQGHYYRWSDFVSWARGLAAEREIR